MHFRTQYDLKNFRFLMILLLTYFMLGVLSVNANSTAFESGEAVMNLNTLQYHGVPISIVAASSNSTVSAFTTVGGNTSSSDNSSGAVLSNASTSLPNIIASAFTNTSQLEAQASFNFAYDGFVSLLSADATASTTITFMALAAGELSVYGNYTLNGDFGGSGHFAGHGRNWRPFVGVSFGLGGFQKDPNNHNTGGNSNWSFLLGLPRSASFGIHGRYNAGDIGTLTITSSTGFGYSDYNTLPEASSVLLFATGFVGMGLWRWQTR